MTGAWLAEVDPPPELFAAVMATGIVSVAADDHGYWRLSVALSILAVVAFVVLGLGFALWVLRRPGHVVAVLRSLETISLVFFWDAVTVWTLLVIGGLDSALTHARR
ncbi:MAG: hypothetical protein ABIZ05_09295 [Pseudonocardiaceae bacterium]